MLVGRPTQHQRLPSDDDLPKKVEPLAEESAGSTPVSTLWKGKGKAQDEPVDFGTGEDDGPDTATYPPVHEDEAETRRIEQNLRLWEQADRQRRKASRDSQLKAPANGRRTSLVGEITRSLWSRNAERPTYASHQPLGAEDADTLPTDSPSPSPHATQTSLALDAGAGPSIPHSPESSTFMQPTSQPPSRSTTPSVPAHPERPPILQASSLSLWKTNRATSTDVPLGPTPPLRIVAPDGHQRVDSQHVRQSEDWPWWTDWLCGCREDKTDEQGGATNPFE